MYDTSHIPEPISVLLYNIFSSPARQHCPRRQGASDSAVNIGRPVLGHPEWCHQIQRLLRVSALHAGIFSCPDLRFLTCPVTNYNGNLFNNLYGPNEFLISGF